MAARVVGCTTIIAVDIKANRLQIAQELGATHPSEHALHPELIAVVKSMIEAIPPPRETRHRAGAN